ncbi:MAG: BsaA family SipW-dependent biofilm matrix protein [Eubacteriales bacterium]
MKKRICFFGIAGFLFLFMVGETFAYNWTQIEEVMNEFQTGTYDTELVEEFTAPSDWLPGVEVNKDVSVLNEGTVPVYARINISQEWVGTEEIGLTFATEEGEAYAAIIVWGEGVVLLSSGVSDTLSLGIPTVDTIEEAQGKWLLLDETPNEEGKFTFYYIGILYEGDETPLLIEAVEMNSAIEADILEKHTVWDMESQELVTTIIDNPSYDYEESSYVLTVYMHTVQATSDALGETFASDSTKEQATIVYLQSIAITGDDVTYSRAEVEEKILYITEEDGKLTYTPSSPDENWFLSFFNMLPGETYTDTLLIENLCESAYDIYMQAIYKGSQSELAEELLEYISMKVYFNDELIYEGSANGEDNIGDLFQVIYLGNYENGTTGTIYVELTLDSDTPMEYAGVLAETNWQFMIGEETEDEEMEDNYQPKTGDESNSVVYILTMIFALIGVAWCVRKGLGIKE